MSDFLSKFNKDDYQDLVDEQADKRSKDVEKKKQGNKQIEKKVETKPQQKQEKQAPAATGEVKEESVPKHDPLSHAAPLTTRSSYRQDAEEDVEIDHDYQRKRKLRMIYMIAGSVLACLLIFFIYYMAVHVKVENFVDKPVSEARAWAKENGVEIELEQEYNLRHSSNQIISQSVPAGKKIKKGKTLQLVSSLGPDPDEPIPLIDFSEMSQEEVSQWIEENQAENLQMVIEYSDDIESGGFIKMTIKDSAIAPEDYRRKDSAAVYFSKGQEIFEKNITIPNFTGAPREEVEKWAETNEIDMTYKEKDSDSVEAGSVISQSEPAEDKIAKRDKMSVVVSVGKAIVVPNFGELTAEEAMSNYPDLNVTVRQAFHAEVPYGRIISQSVAADTKLSEGDNNNVTVVYSEGRPYLKDFRGYLEGDLPKLFFDEYQSKGANIKYKVKFVDSSEIKGTVVRMNKFNEFVPMSYTVEISISNNTAIPPNPPDFGDGGGGGGPVGVEDPDLPPEDGDLDVIEK